MKTSLVLACMSAKYLQLSAGQAGAPCQWLTLRIASALTWPGDVALQASFSTLAASRAVMCFRILPFGLIPS